MASASDYATSVRYNRENIKSLCHYEDLQKAFEQLCKDESVINNELDELLEQQSTLNSKMLSLKASLPNLQLVHNDSKQLSGMISFTSTLATNISSKVRQLDLAKSRVTLCAQRVEDVLVLKFCTDGVQTALQDEDFEKAAAHIHRFLSLDENILRMSADANEGSTLETSFRLLHESQSRLQTIVHRQFDAAVHQGDAASVERFFKIFPLIGQRDDGLAKFSKYLCAQLSEAADKNLKVALATGVSDKRASVIFADTLTLLFEGIARVVEIHQPLVETYYGPGRMLMMMQHLQIECDRQMRRILEHFRDNRKLEDKVQRVQQNMLATKVSAAEKVDPRELDPLLAELTLLSTRAELYLRFVRRRVTNDLEVATQSEEIMAENLKKVDQFIVNCELSRQIQELICSYILMEEYFMREMVEKAVSLDNTSDDALTSSMVDDAFFIIKKCVRRALSSASVDGVCAMLNHAAGLLEREFRDVLYARLRAGLPGSFDLAQAYSFVQTSLQRGRAKTEESDTSQKQRHAFLMTLNDAEVSCEYIQRLKLNLEEEIEKLYGQVNEQGKAKLQSCLTDMGAVSTRFKDVLQFGFAQFESNALKPRMKPWLESFNATSHNITEEEFSNYEANDPWVQDFIVNIDTLLATFKSLLTSQNYDTLIGMISTEITTLLEKNVMKTTFNRLGGLQFDKELRSLVGYLTSVTTWTIRDRFARLTQMATVLNLERVAEILDYWGPNSGPLTWRLTPAEVRQILSLRMDFRSEDIKKLKL